MEIGNYKTISEIGDGGFGTVYQAENLMLGEKACIKINKRESEYDVELLRHEARILWNLDNYHSIPSIKDFFVLEKHKAALVTSYIDGKTIDKILEGGKRFDTEGVCWIAERLLSALHYVHYYGIIHSDIKPENIFVEPQKHDIKLIDFGLATYKPKHTTKPKGYTPRYAAPELLDGKTPIPETDLYGVGIIMLYALGGNIENRSFRDDTPEKLVEFCNRLLCYDPTQRPNWQKEDIIKNLSDIRFELFGRRHTND